MAKYGYDSTISNVKGAKSTAIVGGAGAILLLSNWAVSALRGQGMAFWTEDNDIIIANAIGGALSAAGAYAFAFWNNWRKHA